MGERHPPSPSRTRSETEGDGVGVGVVREGGEAEPEGRRVLWQRLSRDDTVTLQRADRTWRWRGWKRSAQSAAPAHPLTASQAPGAARPC